MKIGIKTSLCILQATKWQDCTQDDLDMVKREKSNERNWNFVNSSTI